MKHNYRYSYKRVSLEPLENEDIESLRVLRNKNSHYFITQYEITEEDQKAWYQSYLAKKDDVMFKVVKENDPKEFIGTVGLYNIDLIDKTAEFGRIVIDKEKAPEQGIGTEVTQAICYFGFEILDLKKIICEVLSTNLRAIKVYKRAGFQILAENEKMYVMELVRDTLLGNYE